MNVLKREKQLVVLSALLEGSSVRSIERMTGVHRDTILRLMNRAGNGCHRLLDTRMRRLPCKLIQVDEVWTFVQKKQKFVLPHEGTDIGDQFVFVALDAESRLVPCFTIGKREGPIAQEFLHNLEERLANRVQLTTDGFSAYPKAVENSFGSSVDFAQLVKLYESERVGEARYSPPRIKSITLVPVIGSPNMGLVSTSYVERQNLTIRMQVRRLTRLTNGFSKRLCNLKAALALHFAHYNFVRVHRTLGVAPAVAAGLETYSWSLAQLVKVVLDGAQGYPVGGLIRDRRS